MTLFLQITSEHLEARGHLVFFFFLRILQGESGECPLREKMLVFIVKIDSFANPLLGVALLIMCQMMQVKGGH